MKTLIQHHLQKIFLLVGYLLVCILSFNLGLIQQRNNSSHAAAQITIEQAFAPLNNSLNSGLNQSTDTTNQSTNSNTSNTTTTTNKPAANSDCTAGQIKGNIGATGSKVYHLPGGSFYNRTKAEACFATEAEAQAAGFRKSKS